MTCAITKCYLHRDIVTCIAWWRDTIYQSAINRFINIVHTFGCVWHDKEKKNKQTENSVSIFDSVSVSIFINKRIDMHVCVWRENICRNWGWKKKRDENVWYRNLKLRMRVQLPLLLSGGKRAKYTQLEWSFPLCFKWQKGT